MFCYQCEETARGTGCTVMGACGKDPEVAALQDLLIDRLERLGEVAVPAIARGIRFPDADKFAAKSLFSTLTNVNFDRDDMVAFIGKVSAYHDRFRNALAEKGFPPASLPAKLAESEVSIEALVAEGKKLERPADAASNDLQSLKDIVLFGLKGLAAYTDHAQVLNVSDTVVYDFLYRALAALRDENQTGESLTALVLEVGKTNLRALELLDTANTGAYGNPVPTSVPIGHKKGKAILVSGHDLLDLNRLLEQTEGTGITVYTHGEMLPAHGYPGLKKHAHFYGHYGTAWQNQYKEFARFPGAILMTTNCLRRPADAYQANIFTSGAVGWPGMPHIEGTDFAPVIARALELPGFEDDAVERMVTVGFGHAAVLGVADKVIDLVKKGRIRHFFLVGGCDGSKPARNYYTEFVEKTPKDTVVLTLACGKYKFFDKDLGTIEGIPRLMDMGQCNDSYSAIKVASALAEAFGTNVNKLPLSMVLSWYEQKAVVVLLTLLSLGIKNIRIGPTPPAFISSNVLGFLVEKFGLKLITTPDEDLQAILG